MGEISARAFLPGTSLPRGDALKKAKLAQGRGGKQELDAAPGA